MITTPPENEAVESGEDSTFTCTAMGSGNLEITWSTTASVDIQPSDSSETGGTGVVTSTLTLSMTNANYAGQYTCTVSSDRGNDSAAAVLSVIGQCCLLYKDCILSSFSS